MELREDEEVKKIEGYDCYWVTNYGRVWSSKVWRGQQGRWLRHGAHTKGYRIVVLYLDGQGKTSHIHRLVAEAFIPNPDNLPFVLHSDGNPENNHAHNLRWGTAQDNSDDRGLHGNTTCGVEHCDAKLTPSDVRTIRSDDRPHRDIAEQYGVSPSTVSNIKRRVTWKHVG